MGIPCYLAMTAAEMLEKPVMPERTAWMACQFSAWNDGLSNVPASLPEGCVLMLSDETPIQRHDPQRILQELRDCVARFSCSCVLLDFQRPGNPETAELVSVLMDLPCPMVVAQPYARKDCGVLLPPAPLSASLKDHLSPWENREIWLELALDGEVITLTEQGAEVTPLPYPDLTWPGFAEETLHCHYHTELTDAQAKFTLWRTAEDLRSLLKEAETLGATAAIGLYQELHSFPNVL